MKKILLLMLFIVNVHATQIVPQGQQIEGEQVPQLQIAEPVRPIELNVQVPAKLVNCYSALMKRIALSMCSTDFSAKQSWIEYFQSFYKPSVVKYGDIFFDKCEGRNFKRRYQFCILSKFSREEVQDLDLPRVTEVSGIPSFIIVNRKIRRFRFDEAENLISLYIPYKEDVVHRYGGNHYKEVTFAYQGYSRGISYAKFAYDILDYAYLYPTIYGIIYSLIEGIDVGANPLIVGFVMYFLSIVVNYPMQTLHNYSVNKI